jgi:hypothetical protein
MNIYQFNTAFYQELNKQSQTVNKAQQYKTAWKRYISAVGLTDIDDVNKVFSEPNWSGSLVEFAQKMEDEGLAAATRETYLSHLKSWVLPFYARNFALDSILEANQVGTAIRAIRELLTPTLSRENFVKKLNARGHRFSVKSIQRIEDNQAWPKSYEEVTSIEQVLGLPKGKIFSKCPKWYVGNKSLKVKKQSDELKKSWNYAYRLEKASSIKIIKDIHKVSFYKSASDSSLLAKGLKRSKKGKHATKSSSRNLEGVLSRYLGFLVLPKGESVSLGLGMGLNAYDLTLLDMLNIDYLNHYRSFLSIRAVSGGRSADQTANFSNLCVILEDICRADGFLSQHQELFHEKKAMTKDQWKEFVEENYKWISSLRTESQGAAQKVYDRLTILKPILDLDRPISAILDLINLLEVDIQLLEKAKRRVDVKLRNNLIEAQVFFAIEAAYPLRYDHLVRITNLTDLIFRDDSIRRSVFLKTRREDYKNRRNTLDVPISSEIDLITMDPIYQKIDTIKILRRYITEVRPTHLSEISDRQKNSTDSFGNVPIYEKQINGRLFPKKLHGNFLSEITYRYMGIRWTPHCNRHIVATDRIKFGFSIKCDGFVWAAATLADSVKTVRKTYARFGTGDFLNSMNELLAAKFLGSG